jgi:hypothetical protein
MSLRLRLCKGAIPAFLVWACAKAQDSDLAGSTPEPVAGKGGTGTGGAGGKGGTGTGGASGKGGSGGVGGAAGRGGTGGSVGGTAGSGSAGAPACGDSTDAGIVVHYLVSNSQESSDQVFFHLYFENRSEDALDLGRVAVRYWMTAETDAFNPPVTDYRGPLVAGERAEYVDDGDFSHLYITFSGNDIPSMNSDLNPTEVQFRIQTQNGARFDQRNDYSFAPSFMTKTPHDLVTAYVDGKLAWGREPSGLCPGEGEGGQGGQGGQGGEGGEAPTGAGQGGEGGV